MNREEFLIQASAYIGVSVGMRDNEKMVSTETVKVVEYTVP